MSHLDGHETDYELVKRVLGGEGAAFDLLMSRIEPDLRGFLRGQIWTRPELSVDDVLQDVRIYLYERLDRYNPEYPLPVFARGLARNIAKRAVYKRTDFVPSAWDNEEENEGPEWEEITPQDLGDLHPAFRRVLGDGRFSAPGGPSPPSRLFLETFEAFLRYGGYPHQQVSFGYSILLWGKRKDDASGRPNLSADVTKVPVTGDPDRVVGEVGPRPLSDASSEMLDELGITLHLDPEFLNRTRVPLDVRLDMDVKDLFAKDRASLLTFPQLAAMRVGLTLLREYFGKDPRKSVADWTHGVKERVRKAVENPSSQTRSPLPMTRPGPRENSGGGNV